MALFSRAHVWVSNEVLTAADLNNEFNNLLTNAISTSVIGYSGNTGQMQSIADPGGIGTESLAASVAEEITRLRYMLKFIVGKTEWYDHTGRSLSAGALALLTADYTDASITGAKLIDGTIPTAKYADLSVTRGKMAAVGAQVSSSSGSGSYTLTAATLITNQTVSLTTTGRPVKLMLQGDGSGTSFLQVGGASACVVGFYRDSTLLTEFGFLSSITYPLGLQAIDTGVSAGTYTYTAKIRVPSGGTCAVANVVLVAYEL